MNILVVLIPVSLCLGLLGLAAFLWTIRASQYDDPLGHASRILLDLELEYDARLPSARSGPAEPVKTRV